jgi:hypothetical protein
MTKENEWEVGTDGKYRRYDVLHGEFPISGEVLMKPCSSEF